MTGVLLNQELKDKILEGARKLNESVSSTLGPYGKTVLIKKEGKLVATKDGVSVAKEFNELEDEGENAGAQLIKEISVKSANEVGDGTTTSTLLAYSMLKNGMKLIQEGSNPVLVKKGIDIAINEVIDYLSENSIQLTQDLEILDIATISGNNDEEVGKLISKAFKKVGKDGIISLEESKTGKPSLDVVEGMQFDKGYKSPYFVTDNEKMVATLNDPYILIYDGNLTKASQLIPILQFISGTEEKSLLIIANNIEGEALATLIVNKMKGVVNSVAVQSPGFGDFKKDYMEDIATICGGKVLSNDLGINLESIDEYTIKKYLGSSRKSTISKEQTTIIDGRCQEKDVLKRLENIKNKYKETTSAYDKEKLQERIGNLSGGVAVIYVGGNSNIEIKEKKDRMEDALYAVKAAIDEGILPGGGVSLIKSISSITKDNNTDINLGKQIVKDALQSPSQTIMQNSGMDNLDSALLCSKIKDSDEFWNGFDVNSQNIINMKDEGIIDPFKVVKTSLINSSSVVGTLLTTSALIYEIKEKEDKQQEHLF